MEKKKIENKSFKGKLDNKADKPKEKENKDPFKYARKHNITLTQAKRELGIS